MAKGNVRSGDVACSAEKRLWGHIRLISDHGGRAGALLRRDVAKNVSNSNIRKYILLKAVIASHISGGSEDKG